MDKSRLRHRIAGGVVRLLLILVSLELGLRAASAVYRPWLSTPARYGARRLTILCLGDSNTWGMGAADRDRESYPAQLQARCDVLLPGVVQVVNAGIMGQNSSEVVNRLEANLAQSHPDLLLVLIGVNNNWNFRALNLAHPSQRSQVLAILSSVKLYRFATLLIRAVSAGVQEREGHPLPTPSQATERETSGSRSKAFASIPPPMADVKEPASSTPLTFAEVMARGQRAYQQEAFPAALVLFQQAHTLQSDAAPVHFWLGMTYDRVGQFHEALQALERARQLDPQLGGLFSGLTQTYHDAGDFERAVEAAQTAVALHPEEANAHEQLGTCYARYFPHDQVKRQLAIQELETAFALGHEDNFNSITMELGRCYTDKRQFFDALERLFRRTGFHLDPQRAKELAQYKAACLRHAASPSPDTDVGLEVLAQDLRAIARIARAHGVRLSLLTYAAVFPPNPIIRSVAAAEHLPLIDLDTAFGDERRQQRRSEFFIADGHPKARGYALVAEIIFQRLLADGVLQGVDTKGAQHDS